MTETENNQPESARKWIAQLKIAGKEMETWEQRADKVIERYRDEKDSETSGNTLNILWSNTETLKPNLYSNKPKPVVTRKFKDKNELGIQAARILERVLENTIDLYDFDDVGESTVEDYVLAGRCIAKAIYEPTYGETTQDKILASPGDLNAQLDEATGQYFTLSEEYQPVIYEEASCEYIHFKDFRHSVAKRWKDVSWCAYRSYLDRDDLIERFGNDVGNKIPLSESVIKDDSMDEPEETKKAGIWEIWDNKCGS